jgi:hypothetical protein
MTRRALREDHEDLATPAEVQRQRVRAGTRLIEFSAGHHPFLSRPEAFAHSIATELARGSSRT